MNHGLYNSGVSTYAPCLMDCTMVSAPHAPRVVQQIIHPMHHGLYNPIYTPCTMECTMLCLSHASWIVQPYIYPVAHALYNCSDSTHIPCTMGCTTDYTPMHHGLYNAMSLPCIMGCAIVYPSHGPYIVQLFRQYTHPIHHGLYNRLYTPCIMGCATDYTLHTLWIVQHIWKDWLPMQHGLYNGVPLHVSWVVQQIIYPMAHGLYNCSHSTCIPCTMGCTQYICFITHGLYNNIPIPWTMDCTIGHSSNSHGTVFTLQRKFTETVILLIASWNGWARKFLVYLTRNPSTKISYRDYCWGLVSASETMSLHVSQIIMKLLFLIILLIVRWSQVMLIPSTGCSKSFLRLSTMDLDMFPIKLNYTNTNKVKVRNLVLHLRHHLDHKAKPRRGLQKAPRKCKFIVKYIVHKWVYKGIFPGQAREKEDQSQTLRIHLLLSSGM